MAPGHAPVNSPFLRQLVAPHISIGQRAMLGQDYNAPETPGQSLHRAPAPYVADLPVGQSQLHFTASPRGNDHGLGANQSNPYNPMQPAQVAAGIQYRELAPPGSWPASDENVYNQAEDFIPAEQADQVNLFPAMPRLPDASLFPPIMVPFVELEPFGFPLDPVALPIRGPRPRPLPPFTPPPSIIVPARPNQAPADRPRYDQLRLPSRRNPPRQARPKRD